MLGSSSSDTFPRNRVKVSVLRLVLRFSVRVGVKDSVLVFSVRVIG